jgi:hypothetical protein
MMNSITAIAAIFVLATLVEAIVEYLFVPVPTLYKPYAAAALAVAVCVAYGADLPHALGLPYVPYVGSVVTGLVAGRGANYLADIMRRIQTVGVPAQNIADVPDPVTPMTEPEYAAPDGTPLRVGKATTMTPAGVVAHDVPAPGEVITVPDTPGTGGSNP